MAAGLLALFTLLAGAGCGQASRPAAGAAKPAGSSASAGAAGTGTASCEKGKPQQIWTDLAKLTAAKRQQRVLACAEQEGSVVAYVTGNLAIWQKMQQDFNSLYPKVRFRFLRAQEPKVMQRVLTEARAHKLGADLIKVSDINVLEQQHLAAHYTSPAVEAIPAQFRGKDWVAMGIDPVMPTWNTQLVPASQAPKGWSDLLAPRFKGKMAVAFPPDKIMYGLYDAWGTTRARQYFKQLLTQNLIPESSHTTATKLMVAGQFGVFIETYSYLAAQLKDKNHAPIGWSDQMNPLPAVLEGFSLATTSPHPYAAALLADYLLSARGQKVWASGGRPAADPSVPAKYASMDALLKAPHLLPLTPEVVTKLYSTVEGDIQHIIRPAVVH